MGQGQVIETLPNYQYRVMVDGSGRITLRNHQFLRKFEIPTIPLPIPSAVHKLPASNPTRFYKPNTSVLQTNGHWDNFTTPTIKHFSAAFNDAGKNNPGIVHITPIQPARFEGTHPSPKAAIHTQ